MKTLIAFITAAGMSLASGAYAATLHGAFYNTGGNQGGGSPLTNTMTLADTFLAGNPTPTATFKSTGIDYGGPSPYILSDLGTFLGADAASLSPASAASIDMLGSVIVLTGTIRLGAGINNFEVFSDDGFSMLLNGVEVGRFEGLRGPGSSFFNVDAGFGGDVNMELRYFEGALTQAALRAALNGKTITGLPTPVPIPAAGFLLISALGGLVAVKRRRKAA
ncbi:VPLPA-CTERM sorting domain-containing protein [Roseovarius aestuariivivens]|uniref:VPLPA-CTERM sorting domain-containing protein n=1 Tax=Roseovarius aestuariivivens TaxID=1888910 RepID=UPI00107FE11D|nr:VPLPA-CTERM sorting domain-containing protein [Roseovarius aestuariivivens]